MPSFMTYQFSIATYIHRTNTSISFESTSGSFAHHRFMYEGEGVYGVNITSICCFYMVFESVLYTSAEGCVLRMYALQYNSLLGIVIDFICYVL